MRTAVLLYILVHSIHGQSNNYGCDVSFNTTTMKPSDPRLINGYNDVLGTIVNLTFDDISLITSAKMLYQGALRHPGGQVGNYWNLSNASYVTPCQTENYNVCGYERRVTAEPPQTFSVGNFTKSNAVGSSSGLTNADYRNSIVFMLNILTLSGNDLLNQVNVINDEYVSKSQDYNDQVYLELGNEYYWSAYSWYFQQNATKYMEKSIPLINRARSMFSSEKLQIAALSQRQLPEDTHNGNKWNEELAAYTKYFDSVTIHDYSLDNTSMSKVNLTSYNQTISYISAYGQAVIPKYIQFVQKTFGDKKIWFTEYNNKVLDADIDNKFPFSYSVLHAMFALNYMSTAICNSDNVEFLMLHLMNSQVIICPNISVAIIASLSD